MKSKSLTSSLLAATVLLACVPLWAHHGTGTAYDSTKLITLKGTVTEFAWANPHVQIYFDVRDDKGNVVHWAVETLSPGKLVRSGWNRDVLKAGDQITISLNPSKVGAPIGNLRKLVLANGKELSTDEQPRY